MATAWRHRLFRIGRMPPALRAVAAQPATLVAQDGISIKARARSISIPGTRGKRSTVLLVGSLVLHSDRVLLAVNRWPILDTPFGAPGIDGQSLTIDADGVHVHVEAGSIWPGGRGTLDLHYRHTLAPTVLAQLPSGSPIAFAADATPILRRCM